MEFFRKKEPIADLKSSRKRKRSSSDELKQPISTVPRPRIIRVKLLSEITLPLVIEGLHALLDLGCLALSSQQADFASGAECLLRAIERCLEPFEDAVELMERINLLLKEGERFFSWRQKTYPGLDTLSSKFIRQICHPSLWEPYLRSWHREREAKVSLSLFSISQSMDGRPWDSDPLLGLRKQISSLIVKLVIAEVQRKVEQKEQTTSGSLTVF